MNEVSRLEARLGALIAAYADSAPIDVDPQAVARFAAGHRRATPLGFGFAPSGLAFAVALLVLLAAIVGGAVLAGGQLLRREPLSVQPRGPVAVIAHYAKIHEGFVFVYEDGRVLLHPDHNAAVPYGTDRYTNYEQRLTETGVGLVRSAAVPAQAFLHNPQLPAGAWADAELRRYQASRYAVCYRSADGPLQDAARVVDLLPAEARILLRGKERIYPDNVIMFDGSAIPGEGNGVACSELTSEAARRLVDVLSVTGFDSDWDAFLDAGANGGFMQGPDGTSLEFWPIAPHGTWVGWGG